MNTETITHEPESTALISVEKINALEVFTDKGMTPIIEEINRKVALLVPDVSSAKGRKEIASMANKIARSKTLLDEVGKNLVADWKAKAKVVDDSRKLMRDQLDQLKEVTREPLTKWEEEEAARVAKYDIGLKDLIAFQTIAHGANVQMITDIIADIERIEVGDDWGDMKERATAAKSYALQNAQSRLAERKQYEEQQEEIKRLREQEAARQVKAAEEKRIAEAADRARLEAEQKAKADIARAAKAAQEATARAEERARQAEANAKREAEVALKREQERQEQIKRDQEAVAKREADVARHRTDKIAVSSMMIVKLCASPAITLDAAKVIVTAIADDKIANLKMW
jgi:hypothetical protein